LRSDQSGNNDGPLRKRGVDYLVWAGLKYKGCRTLSARQHLAFYSRAGWDVVSSDPVVRSKL